MTLVVFGENVRENYKIGMELLAQVGKKESSRAGEVIVAPTPVITVYERPHHRVLLNSVRDANPFFHFMESIWMLSGSNDGQFLDQYVSDFTTRFADDGITLHGAYGYRWFTHFGIDQVEEAIMELRLNPESRRVVIAMWDPGEDFGMQSKDIPCNTHIYFRIRDYKLDMMVNCRSNDIIWGAYGANAVHFSMLQEYMSTRLGLPLGRLYQNSWNFHAYADIFERCLTEVNDNTWIAPYEGYRSLCTESNCFIFECERFINPIEGTKFKNDIFEAVAFPMQDAYGFYKERDYHRALQRANKIEAGDWRQACVEWLERRMKKFEGRP